LEAVGNDLTKITADHVLAAARSGDGVSISVMRDTAKYLGMAAAILVLAVDDRRAPDRDRHARRGRRRDWRGTTGPPHTPMIVLSGAALVLPDRLLSSGTLVIEDGRI